MLGEEDYSIFNTQSKIVETFANSPDTDSILSDVLELQTETSNNLYSISQKPCFDLNCELFSDISGDEQVSQIADETDKQYI